jgi:hypothetical protein
LDEVDLDLIRRFWRDPDERGVGDSISRLPRFDSASHLVDNTRILAPPLAPVNCNSLFLIELFPLPRCQFRQDGAALAVTSSIGCAARRRLQLEE